MMKTIVGDLSVSDIPIVSRCLLTVFGAAMPSMSEDVIGDGKEEFQWLFILILILITLEDELRCFLSLINSQAYWLSEE